MQGLDLPTPTLTAEDQGPQIHAPLVPKNVRWLCSYCWELYVYIDDAGVRPPSPSQRRPPLSAQPSSSEEHCNMHPASPQRTLLQQNVQNKLRQLEQLQYDLTKQVACSSLPFVVLNTAQDRLDHASPGMTTSRRTWRIVESHGKRPFWWPTDKNGGLGLPNVLDTGWTGSKVR